MTDTIIRGRAPSAGLEVEAATRTQLCWDYGSAEPRMRGLYERAIVSQWSAADVMWSMDTDPLGFATGAGAEIASLDVSIEQRIAFEREHHVWLVSQFLHGEQAALACAARLVELSPTVDMKLLAASQAIDEARHVDVFSRYTHEVLGLMYSIDPSLEELLRQIIGESRWDVVCLGMQIVVEGLAIAGLRLSAQRPANPVIADIIDRVARDESRHVAFGMVALGDVYLEMSVAERRDREDFVLEAAHLMSRRFDLDEIWSVVGVDAAVGRDHARNDAAMRTARHLMFARVTTSITRLGLMTERVREGFA